MQTLRIALSFLKCLLALIYGVVIGTISGYYFSILKMHPALSGAIIGALVGFSTIIIFSEKEER